MEGLTQYGTTPTPHETKISSEAMITEHVIVWKSLYKQ